MADWPSGVDKHVYPTLDSTMAEAARLAPDLAGPTWLLAHEQTAARGRRGRDWKQPKGNFAATLIWHPGEALANRALRSFVAALALAEALETALGRGDGLSLKWPNDVLLNGGKLAGILLESTGETLAIGFGVNLTDAPEPAEVEEGALPPVSLLRETGLAVTADAFLNLLAPAFAAWEARFQTYGFPPIRSAWLDRAARLGQGITARTGRTEITGIFETVDEQGALVLKAADGRHHIAAADVFFQSA